MLRNRFRSVFIVFLVAASVLYAQQTAMPKGVTQGATVEGITEYRLENGLRVLLFPDPTKPRLPST
jgi:zinc protease